MRLLFLACTLAAFALAGCSDDDQQIPEHEIPANPLYVEGVLPWEAENFEYTTYQTLIDTFEVNDILAEVVTSYQDGNSTTVAWLLNGEEKADSISNRVWNGGIELWWQVHTMCDDNVFKGGDELSATVTFNNGEVEYLNVEVVQNIEQTDIWTFSFGMDKSEALSMIDGMISNPLPNFYVSGVDSKALVFDDEDKLSELILYEEPYYGIDAEYLISYAKELGLTQEPLLGEDDTLLDTYNWTNGKVNFTLSNNEYLNEYVEDNRISITFTPIE